MLLNITQWAFKTQTNRLNAIGLLVFDTPILFDLNKNPPENRCLRSVAFEAFSSKQDKINRYRTVILNIYYDNTS